MSGVGRELRARGARGKTRVGGKARECGRGRSWARLASELAGLAAAIANGRWVFAAEGSGDGVDAEAALARELFVFCDLREGRKHQKLAVGAGVEVSATGFEVGAETARDNRDQGKPRFANGAGDGLFARRNAARDDYAPAVAEEKGFVDFCCDFGGCGAARDLNKPLVGQFSEKGVADCVAGGGESGGGDRRAGRGWRDPSGRGEVGLVRALSERVIDEFVKVDRAGNLEEIGVLHDRPSALGVAQGIAGHALQLAFAEENRVVEPWEPEGCRAVDLKRRGQGEICLGAGDLETSDDFAERCAQSFVNPDDAVEVLGHDGVLAGLDFGESQAELLPSLGDGGSEWRRNKLAVFDFAENGAAALHDQSDHVKPRFAVIPARQANAGFEVAVLVAFAFHCKYFIIIQE